MVPRRPPKNFRGGSMDKCKCGNVRQENDILNTSGVYVFDDLLFTATFVCSVCVKEKPKC